MALRRTPPTTPGTSSSQPDLTIDKENPVWTSNLRKRKTPDADNLGDFCQEIKSMIKLLQDKQDQKFEKLNTAIEANSKQNNDLLASNTEIQKLLLEYKKECVELKQKVSFLESECANSQNKIDKLEEQLDEMQKFQNRNMIEIRNVPRDEKENLPEILSSLLNAVNIAPQTAEINQIYRRGKDNAPILVEFKDTEKKKEVLQAVKAYNSHHKDRRLNCENLGLHHKDTPFYVSETLTRKTKTLLHAAKQAATEMNYKYCWVSRGTVQLRKNDGSPAVRIISTQQVENLKGAATAPLD